MAILLRCNPAKRSRAYGRIPGGDDNTVMTILRRRGPTVYTMGRRREQRAGTNTAAWWRVKMRGRLGVVVRDVVVVVVVGGEREA